MAFSGSIGGTTFNALNVVDHAFRRCRLPAQAITAEMHAYALDSLQFMLMDLGNQRTPSWCIQKVLLPIYENQPIVTLPVGTVEVLNLNYRTIQPVTGTETVGPSSYSVQFDSPTIVNTAGVKWDAASVPLSFEVSDDGLAWTVVGTTDDAVAAGAITWTDLSGANAHLYFRIVATGTLDYETITLGNTPTEIPMGELNRDGYVNQSNQVFPGRPANYWFQRDVAQPVVNIWPAPFAAAETAQLVLWRHRQVMDTQNLRQEIEIPPRWLEAIINGLAARVGSETPSVDAGLLPVLEQRAAMSMQRAWDGDNDGSPIQINPGIAPYTR